MNVNKEILRLAIPNVISNVTVPLLGLIDLAILGRLGSVTYLDAVAVGSLIFNFVYWNFSFLRMGTSGLTAQAYGTGDSTEQLNVLARGLTIAFFAGVLLIMLRSPIGHLAFSVIESSDHVTAEAEKYFSIRIFAAPATICLFAFSGWFIGMQNSIIPMTVAIAVNICNGVLNYIFAIKMEMNAEGVAIGTVVSQYFGFSLSAILFFTRYPYRFSDLSARVVFATDKLKHFFSVNRDIFLRTFCVIAVMSFFTSKSAAHSDTILAVNTILVQYFLTYSFFIDGFAYAAEALVGKYMGANRRRDMLASIKSLFNWGIGISAIIAICFAIAGENIMRLLTNNMAIIAESREYLLWIKIIPLVSMLAFLWDGVYIGATATKTMRNSLFIATSVFFATYFSIYNKWGNHGLWLAFVLFLLSRGIFQTIFFKRQILLKKTMARN